MLRLIIALCLSILLGACQDSEPKNKRPLKKTKLTMDACSRLPADVVADVLDSDGTLSAKPETFDDDHLYAGGCRYLDSSEKTRALFAIKIDKGGSAFLFLPGRLDNHGNFQPEKPVAGHFSTRYYDGSLWWTSKEDALFQLWIYGENGESKDQDITSLHKLAEKSMQGFPKGDEKETYTTKTPQEVQRKQIEEAQRNSTEVKK